MKIDYGNQKLKHGMLNMIFLSCKVEKVAIIKLD